MKDEYFADMYCSDNGRPAISPSLMACACILQFYRCLSDREMEEACMYDIRIKHALGLEIDERPFDHSSIQDFRNRLLEHGREKMIFDRILKHLIEKKLIKKNEMQRIDATHIIADIAVPSTIRLIKRGIFEVLKMLKERRKDVWDEIAKEIDITEYHKKKVNKEMPGKPDEEHRRRKLVELVTDARVVLKHVENIELGMAFVYRVEMLREILDENVKEDEDGKMREYKPEEKPKDILVSPIDPDARFGAKSKTHKFVGYKENITESVENRFITNVTAMSGNEYDGDPMVSLVVRQKHDYGLSPEKLIGDSAYGSGSNRRRMLEYGTKVVAPVYERNAAKGEIFPKSMFKYDDERKVVTCPEGEKTYKSTYDKKRGDTSYYFPMQVCEACGSQDKCTTHAKGARIITIGRWNKEYTEAEKYSRTKAYKKDMKLRPMIEAKHSEMKRYHGMTRARYRGIVKVELQILFTAAAVNIKRWINMTLEKIKSKEVVLLPV